MTHIETVQSIYAAFGAGDIPTILSHLSESIEWDYGLKAAGVPWLIPGQGLATVSAFFQALSGLQFEKFQPKALFGSGDIVVALIDVTFVIKANGRRVSEIDEVHIWHFNEAGKVSRFTHKVDTHQHWLASRSQEPAAAGL